MTSHMHCLTSHSVSIKVRFVFLVLVNKVASVGSVQSIEFSRREKEFEGKPERDHEDDEEWEDQRCRGRLDDPEDDQSCTLA